MYAYALKGKIVDFTGVYAPYDVPVRPKMVVETDLHSSDELVEQLIRQLLQVGITEPAIGDQRT